MQAVPRREGRGQAVLAGAAGGAAPSCPARPAARSRSSGSATQITVRHDASTHRRTWWPGCAPRSAATAARWPPSGPTTWPPTCSASSPAGCRRSTGTTSTTSLLGCANQAGEDNRNVARMAALLAGLPVEVPGGTVNRLCGSGLDAVAIAARAVRAGDADLVIAGGVESMTRAPFVMPKAASAWSRDDRDPRHHHRLAVRQPGDARSGSAPTRCRRPRRTSPSEYGISREDQDAFALRSQERAAKAIADRPAGQGDRAGAGPAAAGRAGASSRPTSTRGRPRWRRWPSCGRSYPGGTVTAGNASGRQRRRGRGAGRLRGGGRGGTA